MEPTYEDYLDAAIAVQCDAVVRMARVGRLTDAETLLDLFSPLWAVLGRGALARSYAATLGGAAAYESN